MRYLPLVIVIAAVGVLVLVLGFFNGSSVAMITGGSIIGVAFMGGAVIAISEDEKVRNQRGYTNVVRMRHWE